MKKLIATVALSITLVAGFAAAQDAPSENAMEVEPGVFSIGYDVSHF